MSQSSLVKVEKHHFSIERRKYGKGFQYFDDAGYKINDTKRLSRIKKLVIPPMWQKVKICDLTNGHVQAFGYDLKGRKQYIYHEEWHIAQQVEKFNRVVSFAKKLPKFRKFCLEKLTTKGWHQEKVLALMVLVLDETGLRIGNNRYSEINKTYGLSTLRRRHVQLEEDELLLEFVGKRGKQRKVEIQDPFLIKSITLCAELPGYALFRYKNEQGCWEDIDSEDVNSFVKKHMGNRYSCKDFRTWVGTRLAYELYPKAMEEKQISPRKQVTNILLGLVAKELGNTPAICRQYYIHPKILSLIESQTLVVDEAECETEHPVQDPSASAVELALLKILSSKDDRR